MLAPQLVGFDPENRDGIPINGGRCDALLGDICAMGFDTAEANHDNICVQVKPGDQFVADFNRCVCAGSEMLADIPDGGDTISFGKLSHSYLHQTIKNILGGSACHRSRRVLHGRQAQY